jgi:hypothetical protein
VIERIRRAATDPNGREQRVAMRKVVLDTRFAIETEKAPA